MAYDQRLADAERDLRNARAAIKSAYGYCEGAGGHYKDALEAVMATLGDYLWPSDRTAAFTHDPTTYMACAKGACNHPEAK